MHKYIDVAALLKVLLASLVAGVGLVALFGFGLVALSEAEGRMTSGTGSITSERKPAWLAAAGLCFAGVLAGVGLGIYSIIQK